MLSDSLGLSGFSQLLMEVTSQYSILLSRQFLVRLFTTCVHLCFILFILSDVAVYVKESSVFLFPIWGNTIGYVQTNISVHGVSGLSDTNVLLNKPSSPAMSNIEVDWHFERLFYSADQQVHRYSRLGLQLKVKIWCCLRYGSLKSATLLRL